MEAETMIHAHENIKGIDADLFTKSEKSARRKIFQKLDCGLPREETVCYLYIPST